MKWEKLVSRKLLGAWAGILALSVVTIILAYTNPNLLTPEILLGVIAGIVGLGALQVSRQAEIDVSENGGVTDAIGLLASVPPDDSQFLGKPKSPRQPRA